MLIRAPKMENIVVSSHRTERRRLLRAALLAAGAAISWRARAQGAKVLRIVVPFPAGGGTDVLARVVGDKLRGQYGAVIVDNRVGASGRIGVEYVKAASPDGATLLFTPDFLLTLYPFSFRKLAYDPLRDFAPVAIVARSTLALSGGAALPASVKSVNDFLAWARLTPKNAFYATTAAGGTPHFIGLMLAQSAGVALAPVHYKGGAPALQDLLAGQIPLSINPLGEILPYARTGKIRVLATTGRQRSRFLPDVPTMAESGFPGIVIEPWLGLLAPAQTAAEKINELAAAVAEAAKLPDAIEAAEKLGNELAFASPEVFRETIAADLERWRPVVHASGFTAED